MTERVSLVSFLAQNPDFFWIVIHIAWGAIYGSITVSVVFVTVISARYLKEQPSAKFVVTCAQLVWAIGQLAGVFAIPWLIGVIDKDILISGTFVPYWLVSWGTTLLVIWWIFRKKFSIADLK